MIENRVLILGGGGFIGTNLAEHFASLGHKVTVFDLEKPKNQLKNVEYIEGDFFDDATLSGIAKEKDIIIHAISTVNPGNSNVRFLQGYEKDLVQTVKLCSMLIGTQTKLVFLSSGGTVYGNQTIMPIKESFLPKPINHYGSIKLCIENILRAFNTQFKTHFIIARVANPYGPGQDYRKGVGFIDAALKKVICGEKVEIWGDGENVRDYIYITDVCRMVHTLCYYEGSEDTFNISSGTGVSQNGILEILKKNGFTPDVTYKQARTVDVKKMILDNSKITSVYKGPITDLNSGIKAYLSYLLK